MRKRQQPYAPPNIARKVCAHGPSPTGRGGGGVSSVRDPRGVGRGGPDGGGGVKTFSTFWGAFLNSLSHSAHFGWTQIRWAQSHSPFTTNAEGLGGGSVPRSTEANTSFRAPLAPPSVVPRCSPSVWIWGGGGALARHASPPPPHPRDPFHSPLTDQRAIRMGGTLMDRSNECPTPLPKRQRPMAVGRPTSIRPHTATDLDICAGPNPCFSNSFMSHRNTVPSKEADASKDLRNETGGPVIERLRQHAARLRVPRRTGGIAGEAQSIRSPLCRGKRGGYSLRKVERGEGGGGGGSTPPEKAALQPSPNVSARTKENGVQSWSYSPVVRRHPVSGVLLDVPTCSSFGKKHEYIVRSRTMRKRISFLRAGLLSLC